MNINDTSWVNLVDVVNEVHRKSHTVNFDASKKMTVFQLAHHADLLKAAIDRLKAQIDNIDQSTNL